MIDNIKYSKKLLVTLLKGSIDIAINVKSPLEIGENNVYTRTFFLHNETACAKVTKYDMLYSYIGLGQL